jgi:hypothetical protein
MGQIDGVADDIGLFFQRGRHVDGGIGDDLGSGCPGTSMT